MYTTRTVMVINDYMGVCIHVCNTVYAVCVHECVQDLHAHCCLMGKVPDVEHLK